MKKYILITVFCTYLVMLLSFANTQDISTDSGKKFQWAITQKYFVLPKSHAELTLPDSFFQSWQFVEPDSNSPKSLRFVYKLDKQRVSTLTVHDFKNVDLMNVIIGFKNLLQNSSLKLIDERLITLYDKKINYLTYQDTDQNIRAYYVYQDNSVVIAIEINATTENYSDINNFRIDIINNIQSPKTANEWFDKIMLGARTSILIPTSYDYILPFQENYFKADSADLALQCFSFETENSAKEIANKVEASLIKNLGFKRNLGEVLLREDIETVSLQGENLKGRKINLIVLKLSDLCFVGVFEYDDFTKVEKSIAEIVDSVQFNIQKDTPDILRPYATVYDTDDDGNPDYFTINVIFFDSSDKIIAESFKPGEITVKIDDESGKTVYFSNPISIYASFDCIPGGGCSEELKFDGLWLAKLKDPSYKLEINATFNDKKISFEGRLADLIIR